MVFWVAVVAMVFVFLMAMLGFQVEYRKVRAFARAAGE
jgi:uncharacterized membrane protein